MNGSALTANVRRKASRRFVTTSLVTAPLVTVCAAALLLALAPTKVSAQTGGARRDATRTGQTERTVAATTPLPSIDPLPAGVNPFAAVKAAEDAGRVTDLAFKPTALEPKAGADADVSLVDGVLLVRMRAKNVPLPSRFGVPRYALWVYVPNYDYKLYIGDLPITPRSGDRGTSDSAYRFTRLPRDAQFGGLMLTAEPIRFTPIVNEALRPVLVGLAKDASAEKALAAVTIYAAPEGVVTGPPPATPTPAPDVNRQPNGNRPSSRRSTRRNQRTTRSGATSSNRRT